MKTPSIHINRLVTTGREIITNASRSLHFIGLMTGLCLFTHERETSNRR